MLGHRIKCENKKYAEVSRSNPDDPALIHIQKELYNQYMKFWYLDHFNIILKFNKETGDLEEHPMTRAQIEKNNQLRQAESALSTDDLEKLMCGAQRDAYNREGFHKMGLSNVWGAIGSIDLEPIPDRWGVQEKRIPSIDASDQKQKGATCTETTVSPPCLSPAASAKAMPRYKKPCFLLNEDPDRHQSSSSDSESYDSLAELSKTNMAASAPQKKTQQISDPRRRAAGAYAAVRVPPIPIIARSKTAPQASNPDIAATQQTQTFVRWRERSREPLRQTKRRPAVCLLGETQPHRGKVPYRLYEAHDANYQESMDSNPPDSTNSDLDWSAPVRLKTAAAEMRRRWMRNKMIKHQLQHGKSVQYAAGGQSLYPVVHSGDCRLFDPVRCHHLLTVSDIVFCEVQPGNKMMAHKIIHIGCRQEKGWSSPERYFDIGNNADPPFKNGDCYDEHIYGRMVECLGPVP